MEERQVFADHAANRFDRVAVRVHERLDDFGEFGEAALHGGEEESFLRGEVAIDGAVADSEPVGDGLDLGPGEPVGGEDNGGGIEDFGLSTRFEVGVAGPARFARWSIHKDTPQAKLIY